MMSTQYKYKQKLSPKARKAWDLIVDVAMLEQDEAQELLDVFCHCFKQPNGRAPTDTSAPRKPKYSPKH